jgi:hypothetical protein
MGGRQDLPSSRFVAGASCTFFPHPSTHALHFRPPSFIQSYRPTTIPSLPPYPPIPSLPPPPYSPLFFLTLACRLFAMPATISFP